MTDTSVKPVGGDAVGEGWLPGQERIRNIARLQSFMKLERGWDSYDAAPINPLPVMIGIIMQTAPAVVPLSNGGVQMEWHRDGWDIELEITPDGCAILDFLAPAVPLATDAGSTVADEKGTSHD